MIVNDRLELYMVDMKYIRDLHNADNRVTSVSPQIEEDQLIEVDLKIHKNDSPRIIAYKNLCINELNYCQHGNMPKIISDKAVTLYHLCTDENSTYKGKKWCLDFKN